MAGTIDAGELKLTLKLVRENFEAGMRAVNSDLAKMEAGTNKVGKQAQVTTTSMGSLTGQITSLAATLGIAVGAGEAFRQVLKAIDEYGKQETAINRIEIAARQAGIALGGLREEAARVGSMFIAAGQSEMAGYEAMQKMVQATGDWAESERLLKLALDFAKRQKKDAGTVATAVAKAYEGQEMQLNRLLSAHGLAGESAKTFAQSEELLRQGGEGANIVLSDQEQISYDLNVSFDNLADTAGEKLAPAIDKLKTALKNYIDIGLMAEDPLERIKGVWYAVTGQQRKLEDMLQEGFPVGPPREAFDRYQNRTIRPPRPYGSDKTPTPAAEKEIDYQAEILRLVAAREQAMAEMDKAWLASTELWRDSLKGVADIMAETFIELPRKGADAFVDMGQKILAMLEQLAMKILSSKLADWLEGLAGLGSGNRPSAQNRWWEGNPDFVGPRAPGTGGSGWRGGVPQPLGPGSGMRPVYNIVVRGDVTRFAEFSEEVVKTGVDRMQRVGR